jgi:hypothetical protein
LGVEGGHVPGGPGRGSEADGDIVEGAKTCGNRIGYTAGAEIAAAGVQPSDQHRRGVPHVRSG